MSGLGRRRERFKERESRNVEAGVNINDDHRLEREQGSSSQNSVVRSAVVIQRLWLLLQMDTSDASSTAVLAPGQVVAAQESTRVKIIEPTFDILSNPARVMKGQLRVLTMVRGRYTPIKDVSLTWIRLHVNYRRLIMCGCLKVTQGGFIMLRDANPDKDHDLVETVIGKSSLHYVILHSFS